MMMPQTSPRRLVVLAMAFALLWSALAAAFLAPTASANEPVVKPVVSDLVVRSVTVDPQTKVATVRGAVTCTGANRAYFYIEVSQTVGRLHTVYAYAEERIECDGRERFSLELTNVQGRLGPGEAKVMAFAGACTRGACDSARFSKTMRITNAN